MSAGEQRNVLTEGRAAVRRLIGLGAVVLVLAVVGAVGLLAGGVQALDSFEARKSQAILTSIAMRRLSRVANDVRLAAGSDDDARAVGGRPGEGDALVRYRNHDWTLVLDRQGRPADLRLGAREPPDLSPASVLAQAAPLTARARAAGPGKTASGLIRLRGATYLAAAAIEADGRILLSGQNVEREVLDAADRLGVVGARVGDRGPPGSTTIVLPGADGRQAAQIAWPREHPGLRALSAAAAPLIAGFLALALLTGAAVWQIVRVARRLLAYERDLGRAMGDLSDARDRAEAANVAKSQFLANMSHEIRTPLNGVLGMAQALARGDLKPADHDKLNLIRASGENLLSLLNDLLDLSKIEAGCMEIDVHDFDLGEVVRAAAAPFAEIAAQKDLGFVVDVDPEALGVWRGDGGRLRQVLGNLASNAVKFTERGEVRVTVRRGGTGLACQVSDTGMGIAEDRVGQLFQRFSQIDPTATRRAGGTGLGLAICRDLVALMGGQVSVTSVLGQGSTFAFELPFARVGESAAAADPAESDAAAGPLPFSVLAAEDNEVNRLILGALLEPLGMRLRLAADGAEAVRAFAEESFDLVLMDVQMPVMNGVEATRAIRRSEAEQGRRPTPILALSANVMPHQVADYLAAGMDGLIAKPIEVRAMLEAMRKALGDHQPAEKRGAA
jgi:signal transduction histidine kinase/CheY-like chemotaxis protein